MIMSTRLDTTLTYDRALSGSLEHDILDSVETSRLVVLTGLLSQAKTQMTVCQVGNVSSMCDHPV